jgi:galactose oxidase-like protein
MQVRPKSKPLANMLAARAWQTATVLEDGPNVLIVGGLDRDGRVIPTAEVYDCENDSSRLTAGSPIWPRFDHQAIALPGNRVLIVGGRFAGGEISARAEIYDAATDSFSKAPGALYGPLTGHAVVLVNGGLIVFGGQDRLHGAFDSVESYEIG